MWQTLDMCGRIALYHQPIYYVKELQKHIGEKAIDSHTFNTLYNKAHILRNDINKKYNVSPTSLLLSISKNPLWDIQVMRWGLIPSWAKDPSIGNKCFNARSETMDQKPAFRSSYKNSRCIIPIDGYYEWKKVGANKIPFYITSNKPLFLAGLYEPKTNSVTVVTKNADQQLAKIHNRQPIALFNQNILDWLDIQTPNYQLMAIINSQNENPFEIREVSTQVNNSRNESADLIKPVTV